VRGRKKTSLAGQEAGRPEAQREGKMRSRIYLEANERDFCYFKMVSGSHDHDKTIVWVNRSLISRDERETPFIRNPMIGAQIETTEKGALVMRPNAEAERVVYIVEEESGYRGSCEIEVAGPGVSVIASGHAFHSPRGNLGETAWVLANGRIEGVKVTGKKTGRWVDKEKIEYTLLPTGQKIEAIEEGLEQLL
jgi:hypothetical protein